MVGPNAVLVTLAWAAVIGAAPPTKVSGFDRSHIWSFEDFVLVRGKHVDAIRSDANRVVRAINTALASIALRDGGPVNEGEPGPPTIRWLGMRAGIAKVEVIGAEYLTEGMGTTGAEGWLAAATFTLTEIPGVKGVDFVFEEGSHASPGRYTRARFGRFKLVRD